MWSFPQKKGILVTSLFLKIGMYLIGPNLFGPKSDNFSLFFDSIQRYPDESCEQKTIQFIIRNISFRWGFFRFVFPGKNDIPLYFDLFLMSGSEWISILVTSLFFRIYLIYQHVSYRPKLNNRLNFGQILIK